MVGGRLTQALRDLMEACSLFLVLFVTPGIASLTGFPVGLANFGELGKVVATIKEHSSKHTKNM